MGVIRLVVLAVLAYIAWQLVRGIIGRSKTVDQKNEDRKKFRDSPSQDVLVEDPVCHTLVPKHQAIRLRKNGETYYFCSEACCDKFTEPGRGEE